MAEGSEACGEAQMLSARRVLKSQRGSEVLGLKAPGEETWTFRTVIMGSVSGTGALGL